MSNDSAEAQFEQIVSRAATITRLSHEAAWAGDALRAVFLAVTADFLALREAVWETYVVDPDSVADAMARLMEATPAAMDEAARTANALSAHDLVGDFRALMLDTVEVDVRRRAEGLLPSLDYLREIPPPDADDLRILREARLQGLDPAEFASSRRAAAVAGVDRALALDAAGDVPASIAAGYEADMEWLEAYLVESAVAIGDEALLTTELRWLLMLEAVKRMGRVPEKGREAAEKVRHTLESSMCDAEGERVAKLWVALPD